MSSGQKAELTAFREVFRLDDLTLREGERWVLSVRPQQITLGSMVISHRAGALDFGSLAAGDGDELADTIAAAEAAAIELYGAARLNLLCLMMKDPVVHFHVLPRYAHPVDRHGDHWIDSEWPGPPVIGPVPTSEQALNAIHAELRDHLRT